MFARLLIPFCLCCVVLCTFVGILSKRAIEEAAQVAAEPLRLTCGSLIESPPETSRSVLLSDFVFVDWIASIDNDGDGKWEEVAIPLFSIEGFKSRAGYSTVIARFRDVPDLETLHERLTSNELQAIYWARDQDLGLSLHTQLATKFKNMDFRNSRVVRVGYGNENPLLGETSLEYSYLIGAGAIGIAVLTLVCLVSTSSVKQVPRTAERRPTRNRANSPDSEPRSNTQPAGGMLD